MPITEPHVRNGKVTGVPKGCCSFLPEGGGRAAIVSNGIDIWPVPEYCDYDVMTCQMKLKGKLMYVVSLYLDINFDYIPNALLNLLRKKGNAQVIIFSDTNAHSSLWGCDEGNKRGQMVEEFIGTENLVVHNTGTKFTYMSNTGNSIIDVTLSTTAISNEIIGWHVVDEVPMSDHCRIKCKISNALSPRSAPKFNLVKTDWNKFQDHLEKECGKIKIPSHWTNGNFEFTANKFTSAINTLTSTNIM